MLTSQIDSFAHFPCRLLCDQPAFIKLANFNNYICTEFFRICNDFLIGPIKMKPVCIIYSDKLIKSFKLLQQNFLGFKPTCRTIVQCIQAPGVTNLDFIYRGSFVRLIGKIKKCFLISYLKYTDLCPCIQIKPSLHRLLF